MTVIKSKIALIILFFSAVSGFANAATPLTLELEINNSGKTANNVIGQFIFPACSAAPVNLSESMIWDKASRTLSVQIGDFAQNQKKTITIQVPAESRSCLETNQISGSWYSNGVPVIPEVTKPSIKLPKLSDVNFEMMKIALFAIGLASLLGVGVRGLLLYRKYTSFYGLVIDEKTKIPLEKAAVKVFQTNDNQMVMSKTTDAEGRFRVRLLPGSYSIACDKDGYSQLKTGIMALEGGKEISQVFEMKGVGMDSTA